MVESIGNETSGEPLTTVVAASPNSGWNKEVKSLDARISDVLGKLRDREMNLDTVGGNGGMKGQLHEAQMKIAQLSGELRRLHMQIEGNNGGRPVNAQDFSDDLAKVRN